MSAAPSKPPFANACCTTCSAALGIQLPQVSRLPTARPRALGASRHARTLRLQVHSGRGGEADPLPPRALQRALRRDAGPAGSGEVAHPHPKASPSTSRGSSPSHSPATCSNYGGAVHSGERGPAGNEFVHHLQLGRRVISLGRLRDGWRLVDPPRTHHGRVSLNRSKSTPRPAFDALFH